MKRTAKIRCLGYDQIQVTTFCNQKTFSLSQLRGKSLDLSTLVVSNKRSDFHLQIREGDGSISDPYVMYVYRKNYDSGGFEHAGAPLCIKETDDWQKPCKEGAYEATVWDG